MTTSKQISRTILKTPLLKNGLIRVNWLLLANLILNASILLRLGFVLTHMRLSKTSFLTKSSNSNTANSLICLKCLNVETNAWFNDLLTVLVNVTQPLKLTCLIFTREKIVITPLLNWPLILANSDLSRWRKPHPSVSIWLERDSNNTEIIMKRMLKNNKRSSTSTTSTTEAASASWNASKTSQSKSTSPRATL